MAATEDDDVVGFVLVDVVGGCAHIEEVAVARSAGRRSHSAALVAAARDWAMQRHFRR